MQPAWDLEIGLGFCVAGIVLLGHPIVGAWIAIINGSVGVLLWFLSRGR